MIRTLLQQVSKPLSVLSAPSTFLLVSALLVGCGQQTDSAQTADGGASSSGVTASINPAATGSSAGNFDPRPEVKAAIATTELDQIIRLKREPTPNSSDLDHLRQVRRDRNQQIIKLATKVIRDTQGREGNRHEFETAVTELLDARTQIAIQGNRDDVEALYTDVKSLQERDATSPVAVEGSLALIRLAHTKARRYAGEQPEWLAEFSRQARTFASTYPREAARAVPLLFTAGRSCEVNGQLEDAMPCFQLLKEQFSETSHGQQSFGVLRRLQLVGQQLQLEGPTLQGKVVSIDDYRNRVTMVYFWSSQEPKFRELADKLAFLDKKYARVGLRFIGVNLDEKRAACEKFLKATALPGQQIFFSEDGQQRWNNPIARYYGVLDIPSVWFVHTGSVVHSINTPAVDLEPVARKLLLELRAKSR